MKSIELEYPIHLHDSSKTNTFDDTCVFESSFHSKSTARDPAYQFNAFHSVTTKGYKNGLIFQDAGTFSTRNENSLYRNITSFPVGNISNSEFISVKSGITAEMLQNLERPKSKKKKNKRFIQGLSNSIFCQTALHNKQLVTTGNTYPEHYEEVIEVTAQKPEPEFGGDRTLYKPIPIENDDSIYSTIKSKKLNKTLDDPIMDDFTREPTRISKQSKVRKSDNDILIESDSDATTIISNRSHMSFASKSSKNTLIGNKEGTIAGSEHATKATDRSLGYLRERIASKAKDLATENDFKEQAKAIKNKENKSNNINVDTIPYISKVQPSPKEELEKRVVITPKHEINENQSFYTFHQAEPTDREQPREPREPKAPTREYMSHGKTIDTNSKVILPEIGYYSNKHQTQTQMQIDRDFNPYVESIKNFKKYYTKMDSRASSNQRSRGRHHFNDSQEASNLNPNFPLKPYKARPSSQAKPIKAPNIRPIQSTKHTRTNLGSRSPMNSNPTIEKVPTPKELLPRKSTSNGISHIMERIFSKDFEPPRSGVKNISPDQKSNHIDVQKTARIFEEGIRTRTGSVEQNVIEIDRLVRSDKNFDDFLSNFELTYEKEMETYSRKISKESIKQFSSELRQHIREKSYSDLEHNTTFTSDHFSIHAASKTLFDQLFPASRNSSIPSKMEIIPETDHFNTTVSHVTPTRTIVNRGEHNRARSVGRQYRETGKILKVVNNPE